MEGENNKVSKNRCKVEILAKMTMARRKIQEERKFLGAGSS